jgi:hypothetical protein
MLQKSFEENWAQDNFAGSDFNDKRLSNRLIIIAANMAAYPEGSIPKQMECWHDTKACYNFLNNEKVSHKEIQAPHRERVLNDAKDGGVILFLQDTTEADYTSLEATEGLGHIGNHKNKGIMVHNCLAVRQNKSNPEIIGLANQIVWRRKNKSLNKNETRNDRNKRSRESDIWLKNLKNIGSPKEGCIWVSVGDRANDIFEYFSGAKKLGWESLVRACQDRKVTIQEKETYLFQHMRSLPSMGTKTIKIRQQNDTKEKEVELSVSWEKSVIIHAPSRLGKNTPSVSLSVVRCWNEEEGIEWVLYSSIEVNNISEACEKIDWYADRWIIEEYHKCLKTGCKVEERQLGTAKGLENLIAILSIVSILMLQLRNIARTDSEKPASEVVDADALKIIQKRFKLDSDISIGVFWKSVARLGGFLARKNDGEPGWQTLWGGWLRLLDMIWTYKSMALS